MACNIGAHLYDSESTGRNTTIELVLKGFSMLRIRAASLRKARRSGLPRGQWHGHRRVCMHAWARVLARTDVRHEHEPMRCE